MRSFFGLFRRKIVTPSVGGELLRLAKEEPESFATFIVGLSPNERLMVLIGHTVSKLAIQATVVAAKAAGQDFLVSNLVRDSEVSYLKNKGTNEVVSRRVWWCMIGACVHEFNGMEEDARNEAGGRLWAALLDSLAIAGSALGNNALWSKDEKALFQFPDAQMAMQILGKSEVPARFRNSHTMRAFAEENDINLLGRF